MTVHPLTRNVYFAWLDSETEAFDPVRHRRRDLAIKNWDVKEEENLQAHTLTVTTAAMPLSALRGKLWAILSYMAPDGTLWPMIRAERRPVPATGGFGELGIEFSALPSDWENRQEIGLSPLKVAPYFVSNLVAPERQGDPVEILDARRLVGHFDRVTQAFTTKELLGVGLPVKRLTARDLVGWKDGGGVRVRRTAPPLAGVQGEVSWEWTQADDGWFSVTDSLLEAFPGGNVGEPSPNGPTASAQVPPGIVSSLTGESLQNSFPQPGGGVGGSSGYTILTSSIVKAPTPAGAASRTGTVHGQKARFDFTEDADLQKPIGMKLDVEYFDADLSLRYELRQKRRERITFFIANAGVDYAKGKVEKVTAKGYDPTVDTNTLPYLPNENVGIGDQRRVGQYVWAAKRAHLTKGSFDQDLKAADGTEQWTLLPTNGSDGGTGNLASFAVTAVGQAAIVNTALKCMKKLALSKRGNEVDFVVPLDRWPNVSTGWVAELDLGPAGEQFFEGGICRGKVISVRIGKSGTRDFAKAAVTIACCDGTGAASPSPAEGVNPTGEVWDGVSLSDSIHLPIPATPVPFCVVLVENAPTDQLAYVQANDYTGVAPRNDRTANDPKHILTDCKTKVTLSCRPISGQPALTLDASLLATPWPGPAQISLPTV